MKLILPVLVALCLAQIATAADGKKPPVGVPADAKLFNGKWYFVYHDTCDWETAQRKCTVLGGQLAIVPDEPTWAYLRPLSKGLALWLGATDEKTEGLWKWIDGTEMKFKPWHRRQPDNAGGREHYLQTVHNAWNDLPKQHKCVGFICEWKDR